MDWHCLGHAMWLADLGSVRILFDPLIDGVHHGGVFEVEPPRDIDVAALAPDFIVVSHQHADHFDIPSLATLAKLDPEAVIFTADDLVADTVRRLGFRTVAPVETFSRIDLDGARLCSTPSYTGEVEWGLLVETPDGIVWNQIDSYHPRPEQVRETLETASRIFEKDVTSDMALALVRWQPVLETQGPFGERPGFPFAEYADSLARIATIGARAVVPSAAGVRHTTPYDWMNHYVYPVPLRRALRDLAARVPGVKVFPPTIGSTFTVRDGVAIHDPNGARAYVTIRPGDPGPTATRFRPYEMPALHDPNVAGHDEASMRLACERWIRQGLSEGLAKAYGQWDAIQPIRFALEVVFPKATDTYTLTVDRHGARVTRDLDDDYDAMTTVAGSHLFEVIEGQRSWADPMLGGMIRTTLRAYDLDPTGLAVLRVPTLFLYYGLSYEESVRRSVDHQVRKVMGA